jgi:hypothetical protein
MAQTPDDGFGRQPRLKPRLSGFAARAITLAMVVGFVAWGTRVTSTTLDGDRLTINLVAQAMLEGGTYSEADLLKFDGILGALRTDDLCIPLDMRSEIVIRLASVEAQIRLGDAAAAERALSVAEDSITRALACDPNMSMAWIALAWIEFARHDFTPRAAELMRMSMTTGPYEGFSVARRVQLLVDALPTITDPDVRRLLAGQVRVLMDNELYTVLAFNYVRSEDAERQILAEIFATGSKDQQTGIASAVWRSGEDIELPLAPARGSRPWN